jgi:hypothetical protein
MGLQSEVRYDIRRFLSYPSAIIDASNRRCKADFAGTGRLI